MRAIIVSAFTGADAATPADVADPEPGDEVIVEVHAAGVSFPDLLMVQGRYQRKPPLPFCPGLEGAGVVRYAPRGSGFTTGARVVALTSTGVWAEQVTCPPEAVFPLPDRFFFRDGAALPMNYLTAHYALARRGRLRAGETVVVHCAAGGLGTAAIQVAGSLGADTVAVVSSPAKAAAATRAGAHHVVGVDGWPDAVRRLAKGGVDIVVDPVGAGRVDDSLRVLAAEGRLLILGSAGGEIPTIAANRVLLRNIDVIGVAWGAYARARPDFLRQQWLQLLGLAEHGHIRPVHGARFDLEDAASALRLLKSRQATGKVILKISEEGPR